MATGTREVLIKPYYWKFEDTEDALQIHVGGRNEKNQSVHLIIEGFTPFAYLQLPSRFRWDKGKYNILFKYFQGVMKSLGPVSYFFCKKRFPKYLEEVNLLCFSFPNQGACRLFFNKCNSRNGLFVEGIGMFKSGELSVHEHNIDPIIKFTALRKLPLSNWIKVVERVREEEAGLTPEERKYSTADIDLYAKWDEITEYQPPELIVVNNKFFSFDIECYSKNHNSKLPDPSFPENKIFSIACTVGYFGKAELESTLLSLGNPLDIKGVKVVRFKSERDLLLGFKNLVVKVDPDIFIGYNIIKFDWMYLLRRAEILGIYDKFVQLTRCIGQKSHEIKSEWSSSAYGEQQFRYLDPLGRTNVDVLLDIERNYKLPSYSLKSAGEFFKLEEQKEDVTHRQLFMTVDLTDTLTPEIEKLGDGIVPKDERIRLKKIVQNILQMRRCSGEIKTWRDALMAAKKGSEFKQLIRKGYTITGKYNVIDTIVPIHLARKLNLFISMEEISNCMYVPMSYIHTRGQQIKVISQIYRKTLFANMVIPYNKRGGGEGYQGATVIEVNPGDYNNVVTFDFESLYPTAIIACNICYTTLLKENDPTPDSECNLIPISEHVGCPHDPKKRKKKKDEILCKECVYRFRKVKFNPDGTRENEGILPAIERELLTSRKATKKEMAKQEAVLKMVTGLAMPEDIEYYKKMGWKIYKKGELDERQLEVLKILISVLNAQQLAKKVSANSVYGGQGSDDGYMPLKEGARSVTATGRALIMRAIKYILDNNPGDENGNLKAYLVYGDTDSSMLTFKNASTEVSFELGDRISKQVSHYLKTHLCGITENHEIECPSENKMYRIDKYPRNKLNELADENKIQLYRYDYNPINLQFENLYKRYLIFTKKRYVAYAVNRKGEITNMIKKGVVLARRDNCQYLKDTYKKMVDAILDEKSEEVVMNILYTKVNDLFTRQVPDANLIIYMGIKTLVNYAKKNGSEFIDADKRHFEPTGPLDGRLVYPNIPQVLLALKMMRRGDDVPPNTRLEYLYLECEGADHQGEKAEDYTYYRENKAIQNLKPDYLHYVEKQLAKPITELLTVKYPREIVPYEKIEDAVYRLLDKADFLIKTEVYKLKSYSRSSAPVNAGGRTYRYKGLGAKVQYILDAAKRWEEGKRKPNESINSEKYSDLIKACKRWKAFTILNAVHKQYGTRVRMQHRPSQTGEKLRVLVAHEPTEAVLIEDVSTIVDAAAKDPKAPPKKVKRVYKAGERIKLLEIKEEETETSISKKKKYLYTIEMKDKQIIKDVERNKFTTFYYKDSSVMKDIFVARATYKNVVTQLDTLFNPFSNKKIKDYDMNEIVTDETD